MNKSQKKELSKKLNKVIIKQKSEKSSINNLLFGVNKNKNNSKIKEKNNISIEKESQSNKKRIFTENNINNE